MSVPNTPCSANSIADDWFDWLPDLDLEVEPNAPVAVWPIERPSFAPPLIMLNAPPAQIAIIPPPQIIQPAPIAETNETLPNEPILEQDNKSQPDVETQPKTTRAKFKIIITREQIQK